MKSTMNIEAITYSLPNKRETLASVASAYQINDQQKRIFQNIFGLDKLAIDKGISIETLMSQAITHCLSERIVNTKKIRWLIHAHTGSHILPYSLSAIRNIQHRFNLTNAHAFGMSLNKCGSILVGIQIANQLFNHLNRSEYILLITADISFTRILKMIPGTTITTDGASAILLSKNLKCNSCTILAVEVVVDGKFAGGIWDCCDIQLEFEEVYCHKLASVIVKSIINANLKIDDISLILPHNVNIISWKQISKILKINLSKIYLENISQIGHCFGSDPFINFNNAKNKGMIKKGDYLVFTTAGLGATFASMVVQL